MAALILLPILLIFGLSGLIGSGGDTETPSMDPDDEMAGDELVEPDGIERLSIDETTLGDDVFLGSEASNAIDAQAGNDRLLGFGARDFLEGGDGDDFIRGGADRDFLGGGAGNDTLIGGDGLDIIGGNEGDDFLNGQANNDLLIGGAGADTLIGGNGDDFLYSYISAPVDPVDDDVQALDFDVARELAFIRLAEDNPDLDQDAFDTRLEDAGFGDDDAPRASGDGQRDVLEGGAGQDRLFLGAGDEGTGGDGNDGFIFSLGNSGSAEALVQDFNAADDFLIVAGDTATVPTFAVTSDGDDALIQANGETLARLVGQAGEVTGDEIRYVLMSRTPIV